jgi:hypothetical protein
MEAPPAADAHGQFIAAGAEVITTNSMPWFPPYRRTLRGTGRGWSISAAGWRDRTDAAGRR